MKFLIVFSFISCIQCIIHPNDLRQKKDDSKLRKENLCLEEECDHSKELICANNGKTYHSICAFREAICPPDSYIKFKHFGKCTVKEQCIGQKASALLESKHRSGIFVPECNEDGTFAPLQCHNFTMFCWCMSPTGDIIPNTPRQIHNMDTLEGAPDCSLTGTQNRRQGGGPKTPSYHPQGGCEGRKRKKFNNNMIKHMEQDLMRGPIHEKLFEIDSVSKKGLENITLQWKFSEMDINKDDYLSKKEYRQLRRLVRKHLKPRKCAKKFPTFCDIEKDEKISKEEWMLCFTRTENPVPAKSKKKKKKKGKKRKPKLGITDLRYPEPCFRERDQAIEASKNGKNEMYIPVCNEVGYFRPVQCYGSSGKKLWYCFCVDEFTGKMIENTSIQNGTPVCPQHKRWPGCPPPKKQKQLLERLISFFLKEAQLIDSNSAYSVDNKEEWALKIIFNKFDINGNGYIDKKERKRLRKFVRKDRKLRKCGSKIYKVCDDNEDKMISEEELISCILPVSSVKKNKISKEQKRKNLKGKNPFVHIIKPEK